MYASIHYALQLLTSDPRFMLSDYWTMEQVVTVIAPLWVPVALPLLHIAIALASVVIAAAAVACRQKG